VNVEKAKITIGDDRRVDGMRSPQNGATVVRVPAGLMYEDIAVQMTAIKVAAVNNGRARELAVHPPLLPER
jgi:hypothetical protein